jgi:hypothetical protein
MTIRRFDILHLSTRHSLHSNLCQLISYVPPKYTIVFFYIFFRLEVLLQRDEGCGLRKGALLP